MIKTLPSIAVLVLVALPLYAIDGHAPIASKNRARTKPVWIPATAAITASGGFDDSQFDPAELHASRTTAERSSMPTSSAKLERCSETLVFEDFGVRSPSVSIHDLAEKANVIVFGTVKDVIQGFFEGLPASLMRLAPFGAEDGRGDVYFVYPSAQFTVAGRSFCRTDSRYVRAPERGDTVLLFGGPIPDADAKLFAPLPYELLTEHDGQLVLPATLQPDADAQHASALRDIFTRVAKIRAEAAK